MYHTTDLGLTWTPQYFSIGNSLLAIDFVTIGSTAVGYVAGGSGIIAHYSGTVTSVLTSGNPPNQFRLDQNYPNPFNPSTTIHYDLPSRSDVSIRIINLLGQQVAVLVNGQKEAGDYTAMWDASNVPSGIYFYRLQTGSSVQTRKMVVLK